MNTWSGDAKSKEWERKNSVAALKERFEINPRNGLILSRFSGQRVDRVQNFGGYTRNDALAYHQVTVDKIKLCAHRAVWAVAHGRWPDPDKVIDHINGDRKDNRIANLREITQAENISYGRQPRR